MSFKSAASGRFCQLCAELPEEIQSWPINSTNCLKFEQNPFHPSLQLKQVGETWTARFGLYYRVVGYREGHLFRWGWIGSHEAYNQMIERMK